RAHLRGHRMCRDSDRDVMCDEDLGNGGGEVLGGEPSIEGDHDALRLLAAAGDIAGHAIGAAADVVEREFVCDPGSPAVCPEDDGRWFSRVTDQGHLQSSEVEQRSISAWTRARSGPVPRSTARGSVAVMLPRS